MKKYVVEVPEVLASKLEAVAADRYASRPSLAVRAAVAAFLDDVSAGGEFRLSAPDESGALRQRFAAGLKRSGLPLPGYSYKVAQLGIEAVDRVVEAVEASPAVGGDRVSRVVSLPAHLVAAGVAEASRRGVSFSDLLAGYLGNFTASAVAPAGSEARPDYEAVALPAKVVASAREFARSRRLSAVGVITRAIYAYTQLHICKRRRREVNS